MHRIKNQLIVILTLIVVYGCSSSKTLPELKADFYVSTKGSDNWSGTIDKPNTEGTDGPFATLERARDAVRVLKEKTSKDIVVFIRDGFYQLNKTVELDKVLVGSEKADFEKAFLYVANIEKEIKIDHNQAEITFTANIPSGKYDMEAQLIDKEGKVHPAYYIYRGKYVITYL